MPHAHVAFCCFAKRRRVLPNALIVLAFHAVAFVFALAIGFGKMVRRTYVHLRAKGWLLTGGRKGAHGADGYPKGTSSTLGCADAVGFRPFYPTANVCPSSAARTRARTDTHGDSHTHACCARAHTGTRAHTQTPRHTHTHTHTHTYSLTHSFTRAQARTHAPAHTRVRTRLLVVTNVQVVPTAEQLGWMGLSAISMEVAQAAMTSLLKECTCASISAYRHSPRVDL